MDHKGPGVNYCSHYCNRQGSSGTHYWIGYAHEWFLKYYIIGTMSTRFVYGSHSRNAPAAL